MEIRVIDDDVIDRDSPVQPFFELKGVLISSSQDDFRPSCAATMLTCLCLFQEFSNNVDHVCVCSGVSAEPTQKKGKAGHKAKARNKAEVEKVLMKIDVSCTCVMHM
jgi:hypothetical protein